MLANVLPAMFAARADVNLALKQQSRGATADVSRHRMRHALIVTEIAFALILLAGAGFFIRGLQRIAARDPGWRTAGLLTGNLTLPDSLPTDRYISLESRRAFYDRFIQRVAALPGVEHVSLSSGLPIRAYTSPRRFAVEGRADPLPGQAPLADFVFVTPDFFNAVGLQLLAGRMFPDQLRPNSPRVALVNETMARQLWPNESAIGKRIGTTDPLHRDWVEVIGVVRDAGFVATLGLPETRLQIYQSLVHEPWGYLNIAIRSAEPRRLAEPLRQALAELDPDLPVADLRTVDDAVEQAQHNFRVVNQLLAGFGALGLTLAAIGLYGVISTLVVQRTQEFGIRLALGAQKSDVLQLVLGKSLALTLIGTVLGTAGGAAMLLILGKSMPGIPGADPLILLGIAALLLLVAIAACLAPARRAAHVDPIRALRGE